VKRAAPISYIATEGVFVGTEGQQLAQETIQIMDLGVPVPKKRAACTTTM
ncbi:uncharacterized protein BDW43DRAFT_261259, partial [Aspergillus alliaceus]